MVGTQETQAETPQTTDMETRGLGNLATMRDVVVIIETLETQEMGDTLIENVDPEDHHHGEAIKDLLKDKVTVVAVVATMVVVDVVAVVDSEERCPRKR